MSMGLVVLIIWLLNITENHSVNIQQLKQFVYALFTQEFVTFHYLL